MNIRSIFAPLILLVATLTVQAQTPVIKSISQTHGTVNEVIILRGSGFGSAPNQLVVFFGGAASGEVTAVSDAQLQATVPAGATTSPISVVNLASGLTGYSPEIFTLSYDGFEFDKNNLDAPVTLETQSSGDMYSFCVCDFNRDGLNDIVSTNTGSPRASVFQNTTTDVNGVSFVQPPSPDVDARGTRWVRCGDMNGDGLPDLVFSFSNESTNKNRVVTYRNTSTPGQDITFEEENSAGSYTIKGDQGGRSVIRDLDGDGKPELIVADLNGRGGVSIFRNTSTKTSVTFQTEPVFPFTALDITSLGVKGIDVADLNGDGLPDLVASSSNQDVHALINASTPGSITFSTHTSVQSSEITNLKLGDMDGDGQVDIVISSKSYVGVFRNVTDSAGVAFSPEAKFNLSPTRNGFSYLGLDLADMDGNGLLDVITANEDAFPKLISVVLNHSSPGALDLNESEKVLPEHRTRSVRAADFNGDGKPDLAYTDIRNKELVILLNRNCIQPVLEPVNGLSVCDVIPYQLNATKGIEITHEWEVSDDGTTFLPLANAIDSTDTYTTDQERYFRVKVSSSHGRVCAPRVSNAVRIIRPEGFVPGRPEIIDPNPATPYCFGDQVVIETKVINAAFVWTDPEGNVIPEATTNVLTLDSITAAQAGTYSVYVQASPEQGGCVSDVATTTIQVSEPPLVQIIANQPPVLLNDATQITLSFAASEGHTYAWQKDGQPVANATTPTLTVSEPGRYVAVLTNDLGCTRASAPFTVASAQPTIPATVCLRENNTFRMLPDSVNATPVRYRWTFGDGTRQEGSTVTHAYTQAGDRTVVVEVLTAEDEAADRIERSITVFDLPELTITPEGKRHLCPGETVTLIGNDGFDSYAWNTGETTATLVVSEAGTYSLTVTTNDGCTLSEEIEVRDVPNPEALIVASSERVSLGDTLRLTASGGDTYRWSPATGLSDTTVANPVARPLVTTTYACAVTTDDGCLVTAEYTVYVDRSLDVEPERIFSPNGDGQNDTWFINKMDLYPDCRLTLFNRQGVKIFERENYSNDNPWNGTGQSQGVPAGVYFYLIDCGDEAGQQTGSVTIVR